MTDFLEKLPDCQRIFSDGATMYQSCWVRSIVAQKSKETNLIESFNFYCRNFNSCLTRRSLTYAKTKDYFNHKMIEVVQRWIEQFGLTYFLKNSFSTQFNQAQNLFMKFFLNFSLFC